MGPKIEEDLFPKVSREKRGTVSNEVSRGTVRMKKVRNVRWLKTETSNSVLNPSLPWKPVECSEPYGQSLLES